MVLFFKIFLPEDQYTFACIWTNFRSTLSVLSELPPKHGFWRHQRLFQTPKNVDHAIYFRSTGIKNLWVSNQACPADDSIRCFDVTKIPLVGICKSSHCHDEEWSASSSASFEFLRGFMANKFMPFRIDQLAMLHRYCGHVTGNAEKIGNHLLRYASSKNNFCWICLIL